MKPLDLIATILLIVGGLNWGLVAAANFDLVAMITGAGAFGEKNMLGVIIYGLVGLSAIYLAFNLGAFRRARA
ncbi:MAG: DUF378 domain-containing protein [Gemmatimonadales bacterium]